jgi:hypothetical protein
MQKARREQPYPGVDINFETADGRDVLLIRMAELLKKSFCSERCVVTS